MHSEVTRGTDVKSPLLGRRVAVYWIIVVAVAVILWIPRLSGPIDLRWDGSVYYVLGTSLSTGAGYRIISEPGCPEALQYPPLLPGIIAMYQRVFHSTDPAIVGPPLRISYAALFVTYGVLVFALATRYLVAPLALVATLVCLLHHSMIFFSDILCAELPFAVITVALAFAMTRGGCSRPRRRELVLLGLATVGFALRTAGIALFAALILEPLARRRWALASIRAAIAIVPIAVWQLYIEGVRSSAEYRHPAYEYQRAPYLFYNVSYAENASLVDPNRPELGRASAGTMITRSLNNLPRVGEAIGESVTAYDFYWRLAFSQLQRCLFKREVIPVGLVSLAIIMFAILTFLGFIILIVQNDWRLVSIGVASIALVCATPWAFQFERYLAPMGAILTIAMVVAVSELPRILLSRRSTRLVVLFQRWLFVPLFGGVLLLQAYTLWKIFQERSRNGAMYVATPGVVAPHFFSHDQVWFGWEEAVAWLKANAPSDAIIATSASHLCYLYTGRKGVAPPVEHNPSRTRRLLESVPVSYVIVDRSCDLPAIETGSQAWQLVKQFHGTRLYVRRVGSD